MHLTEICALKIAEFLRTQQQQHALKSAASCELQFSSAATIFRKFQQHEVLRGPGLHRVLRQMVRPAVSLQLILPGPCLDHDIGDTCHAMIDN